MINGVMIIAITVVSIILILIINLFLWNKIFVPKIIFFALSVKFALLVEIEVTSRCLNNKCDVVHERTMAHRLKTAALQQTQCNYWLHLPSIRFNLRLESAGLVVKAESAFAAVVNSLMEVKKTRNKQIITDLREKREEFCQTPFKGLLN